MTKIRSLTFALILTLFGLVPLANAYADSPSITVSDAFSRPAIKGGSGAVFMVIQNDGTEGDVLLSAKSDVAQTIELHTITMKNDMMQMRSIESVDVPAGQKTAFFPGGMHIMLINLNHALKADEVINLTLNFEKAGEVPVRAQVQNIGHPAN